MAAAHLRPWRGTAFRHIPFGSSYDVLDTRFAGRSGANRWNEAGERTLYLAGDPAVALAELARHFRERQDQVQAGVALERSLFRLSFELAAVLDLRATEARRALGLSGGVRRFLDADVARATASYVRRTTSAEALLVPSMAFLDDPTRWNLVLFLEKLPTNLDSFISVTPQGTFRVAT